MTKSEDLPSLIDQAGEGLLYAFYSTLILALEPCRLAADGTLWCVTDPSETAEIQELLQQFANSENTQSLLETLLSIENPQMLKEKSLESDIVLLIDIFSMDPQNPLLQEILKGANVKLLDSGFFYEKWAELQGSYKRLSSHNYIEDMCQGKPGMIINEFLFWKDLDGNTRFQLEKTPTTGPLFGVPHQILHLMDYLVYKRDDLQQSQFGCSKYTEKNCLQVSFDKIAYQKQKKVVTNTLQNQLKTSHKYRKKM